MAKTLPDIVDTLRGRILRGVQAGTLGEGDRLPSARDLVSEFDVDHRQVLAAYRQLAEEGLVELRPRGGIYIATQRGLITGLQPLPESWVIDVLTGAFARAVPAPALHEWLRRCTETLRLRAVVIASTPDQLSGLSRELVDDFGLETEGLLASEIAAAGPQPLPLRRADLIVSTAAHAASAGRVGQELRKPVIVIEMHHDIVAGEWALLLRRPVYAVVATAEFGEMLQRFFAETPGVENLRVLLVGRDDVSTVPDDVPTYVTRRAREVLGDVRIPGRILPPARTISTHSAREIFAFVVRSNMEAMASVAR